MPAALAADEYQSLFNGQDLTGWDGDPRFWRAEDGAIVGQTTESNKAEKNTFLIYRGGEFGDFQLQFEYQVDGYNSGVQYRSEEKDKWNVGGYQADFEARWHASDNGPVDQYSGMFFDEQGRMFMGQRGEAVIVRPNSQQPNKPHIEKIGTLGDSAELESVIRRDGWNQYQVIANGYQFTHVINGRVMAVGIDLDTINRRASGIIAFQLHSGPPMQIKLRNIRIRELGGESQTQP
jgi:hypothetical protein